MMLDYALLAEYLLRISFNTYGQWMIYVQDRSAAKTNELRGHMCSIHTNTLRLKMLLIQRQRRFR